jgi:hypothetical protein
MKLKYRRLCEKAVVIGALVLLITVLSLIKLNENVSEYFYARGVSRAYVYAAGHIASVFGFSSFDFFVICCIIVLAAIIAGLIVLLVKKYHTKAAALAENTVIAALVIATVYVCTASGCYYRAKMPLPSYEGEQLTTDETAELVTYYLNDFSAAAATLTYDEKGKSVSPYTVDEISDLLEKEYERLDDSYFSSYTPKAKKSVFSGFMSYQGVCGVTFLPCGEAVINAETPDCYLVLTTAHELAHTKGVMRERDANLLAYYILITSEIPYFRYSAYMYGLNYLTGILYRLDNEKYTEIMSLYPASAILDKQLEYDFWESKDTFIETVSTFFNDVYLKLSGVSEGTDNYSDPSGVSEKTVEENGKTVTVVSVTYSDTAKMFIAEALGKIG